MARGDLLRRADLGRRRTEICVLGAVVGVLVSSVAMLCQSVAAIPARTDGQAETLPRLADVFGYVSAAPVLVVDRVTGGCVDWSVMGCGLALPGLLWGLVGWAAGFCYWHLGMAYRSLSGSSNAGRRRRLARILVRAALVIGVTACVLEGLDVLGRA